jgi:hypothetical protein
MQRPKTCARRQELNRGVGYLAAPQTFTAPPEKKEKKLCRNEHTSMHALEVDKEKKTVAAAGHESTTYKQTQQTNNSIDAG